MNTTIRSRNYQVHLGDDALHLVEKYLSANARIIASRKIILVDDNTKEHCLPQLQEAAISLRDAVVLEIPNGEASKSIDTIARLWKELTDLGADRNTVLVNLGGGVVSDIGGFTAATYMRGIHFVNVPTTLLSMVDASVGGKNGINFGGYKNQVGTFDEPGALFVWPDFLKTLPSNELRSGFAEVIKHAIISDQNKWNEVSAIENFNSVNWFEVIKESIWTKNKIVNSDYRDKHLRKSLNFGHTIGHALESYSQKHNSDILKHGEAIAIGMIGEIFLSEKLCGLNKINADEICRFIAGHYPLSFHFENDELLSLIKGDKKNESDHVNFSLIRSIGEPVINQHADEALILQSLDFCREQMTAISQ
ncbi:MAG: 3-dehydroquinate synthase [Bacteroidetes bacterium]|nr:3-dehydroquinate synthase [Bacteroidota bacterium]